MTQEVERELLKDIRENPDDDTARLVLADWLCENGHEDRGDFIRCQVRNQPMPYSVQRHVDNLHWIHYGHSWVLKAIHRDNQSAYSWDCYNAKGEAEYLGGPERSSACHSVVCKLRGIELTFRRGFVEELKTPCQLWMEWAGVIMEEYFLKRAGMTDRSPSREVLTSKPDDAPHRWMLETSAVSAIYPSIESLPEPIFSIICSGQGQRLGLFSFVHPNKKAAESALSHTMLIYGARELERRKRVEAESLLASKGIPLPIRRSDFVFPKPK
jgi:uncharacterized protein (TIGR02996 family)